MDQKTTLLEQLRIDRSSDHQTDSRAPWLLWGAGALLLVLLAAAGWWFFLRNPGVPVHVAVAKEIAAAPGSTAVSASALDASGYVVARRQATVSAKTIARVLEVLIEEGQKVSENQVVARLDDSNTRAALEQARAQLAQSEASLQAATIALKDAEPIFRRNEQQVAAKVISAQEFDNSKAVYEATQADFAVKQRAVEVARSILTVAQRQQDDMTVRAPFAGVVTDKAAQQGEIVSPSTAGGFTRTGICTIVDMDSLEVDVDVSENFINRVRPGQPSTVRLNAYPDWEIPAEVLAVIPTADRSKATVKVRVGFKQKDPRILPEMGARVSFLTAPGEGTAKGGAVAQATMLPPEAIDTSGDSPAVYVIDGSIVEKRSVRLGAKTSEGQTVLSGIGPGARVAVGDFTKLSDNGRVAIQE